MLAGWLADEALAAKTVPGWPWPISADEIERRYFEEPKAPESYAAWSDGRLVGHFGLVPNTWQGAHIIHLLVDPALAGQGYGSAMIRALQEMAFGERGIHRLSLSVYDDNVAAIDCYLRAGFRIEGHHLKTSPHNGQWRSHYTMAKLAEEWRVG